MLAHAPNNAPHPSLMDLPDVVLSKVLAAAAPKPLKGASPMAVCKRFCRLLAETATCVTLGGAMPPPQIISLLRLAVYTRHIDMSQCVNTWPLMHILPHLPRVKSVKMQLTGIRIRVLPPHVPQVEVTSIDVSSPVDRTLLRLLQARLEGGTVVVHKLHDGVRVDNTRTETQPRAAWDLTREGILLVRCAHLHDAPPPAAWQLTTLTALKLSATSERPVPDELGALTHLRDLEVERYASLPGAIGKLTALTRLRVADCATLQSLPPELGQLRALQGLSLDRLGCLTSLPLEVALLVALKRVDILECGLQSLALAPGWAASLAHLSVHGCKRPRRPLTLPRELSELRALQHLSLGCSRHEALPPAIYQLTALRSLKLQGPPPLPDLIALSALSSLQSLHVSGLRVPGECPVFLTALSALTYLCLHHCKDLAALPQDMSALSQLRELRVTATGYFHVLPSFPQGVTMLRGLQRLFIQGAQFKQVPDSIAALSALASMTLRGCGDLTAVPEAVGRLSALQRLAVTHCPKVRSLPEVIGNLSALTALDLGQSTSFRCLPESIARLTALEHLHLANCSLTCLPCGIGCLPALRTLNLQENVDLETLPDSAGGLSALESLDLSGCKALTALPRAMARLLSLRTLDLMGCTALRTLPHDFTRLRLLHLKFGPEKATQRPRRSLSVCFPAAVVDTVSHMCDAGALHFLVVAPNTYDALRFREGLGKLAGCDGLRATEGGQSHSGSRWPHSYTCCHNT